MLSRLQGWTRSRCFRASLDLIACDRASAGGQNEPARGNCRRLGGEMRWEWLPPSWEVAEIDTTALTPSDVAAEVLAWCRGALGPAADTAPEVPGWSDLSARFQVLRRGRRVRVRKSLLSRAARFGSSCVRPGAFPLDGENRADPIILRPARARSSRDGSCDVPT
jgi:hypothetical protein